jgi:NAD+ kinase
MLERSLAQVGIRQVLDITEAAAMVVIGGDGTLIHAVHKHNFPNIPLRGINTGTIGFFMSTDPTRQEIADLAHNLRAGAFRVDNLAVLEVQNEHGDCIGRALNEAVIRSSSGQALHMALGIGSADFGKLTADGAILSTPSGSTGYAKSAGGPFIHEALRAYEVVPLNPYYSPIDRPAIVPATLPTTVSVFDTAKRPYQLSVDGMLVVDSAQGVAEQDSAYSFAISNDTDVKIIRFNGHEYFKKLGQKIREIREHHSEVL